MIEFEKEAGLVKEPAGSGAWDLDTMGEEMLLVLRAQIDERLPTRALGDLNLEEELVLQYQQVKAVLASLSNQADAAPNHKSQLSNSVATSLAQLVKLQESVYSSERFKTIELMLIEMLRKWPDESVEKFMADYEALYAKRR